MLIMLLFSISIGSCQSEINDKKEELNNHSSKAKFIETTNGKYYELVLIWVQDPAKFQEYGQKVGPIVQKYGGGMDKIFAPSSIYANGMEQPHIVNLVHYDSKEAYEKFVGDTEFKKIEHLRNESIKMMSFRGYLTIDNSSFENLAERSYNIELANYKSGNNTAYKKYEEEGENKMKKYGFNVEFKLDIKEHTSTLNSPPDFAKISFFNNPSGMAEFEKDPAHKLIEEQLYPNATDNVIWITGVVHPMMLKIMNIEE